MSRFSRKRKTYRGRTSYDTHQDKRIKFLERVIEKWDHTITLAKTSAYTAGTAIVDDLNFAIATGDTATGDRTGNAVVNISISYRCRALVQSLADATNTGSTLFRFMLLWDKEPKDTIMAAANLLEDETVTGLYNINKEFAGRFQVLRDEVYGLPMATAKNNSTGQFPAANAVFWKGFIPLKARETTWTGTTGTQGTIEKNQLILITLTSNGTTNSTTFVMDYRIFYKG